MPALIPLDAALYKWIAFHRSCQLDFVYNVVDEWPLRFLTVLAVLAVLWLVTQRQWLAAWHGVGVVLFGSFVCEMLKTGFERARPSVLTPTMIGNSFPSGHAAAAILLAGALGFFLVRYFVPRWGRVTGVLTLSSLVSVIVWQRLYLAHHWASDVIGSVLLAGAWLCFSLPRTELFVSPRRVVLLWGISALFYGVFYFLPAARMPLASAALLKREPLLSVAFGSVTPLFPLHGAWGPLSREPAGPLTWMMPGEASVEVELPGRKHYSMELTVRPFLPTPTFACYPLEVWVNKQPVHRLFLSRGWREYELQLDPTLITPGLNMFTFRTGAGFPIISPAQTAVAFHRVSVFAEQ